MTAEQYTGFAQPVLLLGEMPTPQHEVGTYICHEPIILLCGGKTQSTLPSHAVAPSEVNT